MTKAALREQRRAQRIAKRNRQRIILGVIIFLVVLLIGYLVYNDYVTRNQPATSVTIGDVPHSPSANAITTASGLVYEDLQFGDGATAQTGDLVSVHYSGWLDDGTKFDSSLDSGQPLDFTVGAGSVIEGWDEGVVGMRVNGIRLLVIPPSLGYGTSDYGPIPGNSTLTFEVQLVAIK